MKTIELTKGYVALVDDADFEWLSQRKWCASYERNGNAYALRGYRSGDRKRTIKMHREIMGAKPGQQVDHKNGDTLDNRRANLRICTQSQNNMNRHTRTGTSRYKGVCWSKAKRKWQAGIQVDGKTKFLGYFHNEIEAARAYDVAARDLFGEYANLNFPNEKVVAA